MSRGIFDIDREINRQRVLDQQLQQRQALDEQRISPKPVDQRYRDGRMSDEEYNNFEQSSLGYFKEQLLKRIEWNSKLLSQYDMLQAMEFAEQDPEFKRRFEAAKSGYYKGIQPQKPISNDVAPEKVSKFQQLMQMRKQQEENLDDMSRSIKPNYQEDEAVKERMKTTIYVYQPSYENKKASWLQTPDSPQIEYNNGGIQQIALYISSAMGYLLTQQTQLLHNFNQPNEQISLILREIKEQREEFRYFQNQQNNQLIGQLQSKVDDLNRKVQQQEMDARISQINYERSQLQREMHELRQEKGGFLLNKTKNNKSQYLRKADIQYFGGDYNPSSSRNLSNQAVSPRMAEEREKICYMIRTEFGSGDQNAHPSESGKIHQISPDLKVNDIVRGILEQAPYEYPQQPSPYDNTIQAMTTIIQADEAFPATTPQQMQSHRVSVEK